MAFPNVSLKALQQISNNSYKKDGGEEGEGEREKRGRGGEERILCVLVAVCMVLQHEVGLGPTTGVADSPYSAVNQLIVSK